MLREICPPPRPARPAGDPAGQAPERDCAAAPEVDKAEYCSLFAYLYYTTEKIKGKREKIKDKREEVGFFFAFLAKDLTRRRKGTEDTKDGDWFVSGDFSSGRAGD